MMNCVQSPGFFRNCKQRRERVLRKMAQMRAAKERKRLAQPPPEPEPRPERWYRFEYGVRDKITGETHWRDLVSARQAHTALGLILKFCQ